MKVDEQFPVPGPARGHDVFVSYSRADRERVVELTRALAARGKRAWVDLEDIPPSAEWMAEIRSAIESADDYLVVISPSLAGSKVCAEELEHAKQAGKRIVPVLVRPTDPSSVPPTLAALNWIDATAGEIEDFTERIVQALQTDLDHVRAHTRLLVRAREWEGRHQPHSLLLRGEDLKEAEALLVTAQGKEPAPTPVQARFVQVSRYRATRRQRSAVAIAVVVALGAATLGAFAWQQRGEAIDQRAEAVKQRVEAQEQAAISKSRELAAAATSQLDIDPELSLLLAIEGAKAASTPEVERALRDALIASNHVATLSGHRNPILDASFSEDGTRLLTTSYWAPRYVPQGDQDDLTTRIWDLSTGLETASIDVSASLEPYSELAPSGDRVLSSRGMTPFIADASGVTIVVLERLGDDAAHFDPSGKMVVGRCADGTVCVVEASTGDLTRRMAASGGVILSTTFTPDGRSIVALTRRGVLVWDAGTGRLRARWQLPWPASWMALSGDGKRVLVSNEGHLGIWSVLDGEEMRLIDVAPRRTAYPRPLEPAIDVQGTRVASADDHGTVTVWSVESGESLSVLPSTPAADVEFAPSGHSVMTTSENHTATVWDADTGEKMAEFLGTPGSLWLGRFSPNGSMVVTAGSDLAAQVWLVDTGAPIATLSASPGGDGQAATFGPDGDVVYTGGYAGVVRSWDPESGRKLGSFAAFPSSKERYVDWVWSIDVSPDGSTIAASGSERMIRVMDAGTGEPLSTLRFRPGEGPGAPGAGEGLAGVTWSVAFSPDGSLLATASQDGIARLWDPHEGELVARLSGHDAAVDYLAFDPDGTKLLTGSDDGTARIWAVPNGTLLLKLEGQPQGVTSVAWSPDGKLVATTSYDGTLFIRDAISGEPLHRLTGSSGVILAVAFSPDGRWLATSSDEDGALRIWDAATGRLADVHEGALKSTGFSIGFSPDGERIIIPGYTGPFGSGTGETLVYRCDLCVELDGLIELAGQRVTRTLTDAERERFLHEG